MSKKETADVIEEAMANLAKSAEAEDLDSEDEEEEGEEETSKAIEMDFIKAEDTEDEETAMLIQADDFMRYLASNQDENTGRVVKGLEGNMNATHSLIDLFKGFSEQITALDEKLESLMGQPQPRRSVMSKAEAQQVLKGSPREGSDRRPITKKEIIDALAEASRKGEIPTNDVLKAESAFGSGGPQQIVPLEVVYGELSQPAKAVIDKLRDE